MVDFGIVSIHADQANGLLIREWLLNLAVGDGGDSLALLIDKIRSEKVIFLAHLALILFRSFYAVAVDDGAVLEICLQVVAIKTFFTYVVYCLYDLRDFAVQADRRVVGQ